MPITNKFDQKTSKEFRNSNNSGCGGLMIIFIKHSGVGSPQHMDEGINNVCQFGHKDTLFLHIYEKVLLLLFSVFLVYF